MSIPKPEYTLAPPDAPEEVAVLVDHVLTPPHTSEYGFTPLIGVEEDDNENDSGKDDNDTPTSTFPSSPPAPDPLPPPPSSKFVKVTDTACSVSALGIDMSSLGALASTYKGYWMSTRHLKEFLASDPEAMQAIMCGTMCLLLMCPDTHSAWSDRKTALEVRRAPIAKGQLSKTDAAK